MSTHPLGPQSRSVVSRLARVACPGPERAWLSALLAEAGAIESPAARLRWILGASVIVLGANVRQTLAALRIHPLLALAIAGLGWMVVASPSLLSYELMNTEDDLFLLVATVMSGALLSTTVLALLLGSNRERVTLGGRP